MKNNNYKNNKFNKGNNGTQTKRAPKPTPISVSKTYDTDYIADVLVELFGIDPGIVKIFFVDPNPKTDKDDYYKETLAIDNIIFENMIFDDAVKIIVNYAATVCTPKLIGKEFIHCSVSAASNRFYIRIEDGFSINVEAKYHINNTTRSASIDSYVVTYTTYNDNTDAIEAAKAAGYETVERKPRH